ncbi:hypothetical protein Q3G72_017817 [Acer saccharum]|nr:hypothetical protein Q3G72_017817 [Acer saccharum]
MVDLLRMREPYQRASKGNWEAFEEYFTKLTDPEDRYRNLVFPMTIAKDTALHLAVHSGRKRPLEKLLGYVGNPMDVKNVNQSTILHEAAVNRNIEALKLLIKKYGDEPLLIKNKFGETPLFTAAAFGSTEVVKYLASQPNQMTEDGRQLKDIHRIRDDGRRISILYVAIRGQHFETALELLKLDESLAGLKNKMGMTGLQLLAGMPSAFRSRYHMDLWKLFFYTYLPAGGVHIETAENDNQFHSRDLESGQSNNCRCCFSLSLCKDTTWLSTEDQPCELEGPKEQTIAEEHEDTWEDHDHSGAVANRSTSSSSFAMGASAQVPSPLLLAAAAGIMEIVKEMIRFCPQEWFLK